MKEYGFEITEDGLVILRPKPTDPFGKFVQEHLQAPPIEIKMSPEFVAMMESAVVAWQISDRGRQDIRRKSERLTASNVDPDGEERSWVSKWVNHD